MDQKHEEAGRKVVHVLEKILAKDEGIRGVVERAKKFAEHFSESKRERRAVQFIIQHYSNLSAAGGGISALPGLLPAVGTVFSVFGAGTVDAVLALKFETEMVLALATLLGRDISDPKERKIAILLACASMEDAYNSDREPSVKRILDLAVSEYSTRELSISLAKAVARVLWTVSMRRFSKFVPFIGIAVGASINKVMTMHAGYECWRVLKNRGDL